MFWIKIFFKVFDKRNFQKIAQSKVGKNYIVTKIHQKVALALLSIFWHFLQVSSQDEQSQLRGSGSGSFSQGSHLQENFDHFRCEGSPQNHPVRHVETRTQQGKNKQGQVVSRIFKITTRDDYFFDHSFEVSVLFWDRRDSCENWLESPITKQSRLKLTMSGLSKSGICSLDWINN